ncbi:hypothetical protein OG906_18325 [Streptomyces sp. NBC_01426]|nr:hypothetical protein [Streptomyces sp. NBC_01426]
MTRQLRRVDVDDPDVDANYEQRLLCKGELCSRARPRNTSPAAA